jgi:L-asparagine transporter-like permease
MEYFLASWILGIICTSIVGFFLLKHLNEYLKAEYQNGRISQQNRVTFGAACAYISVLLIFLWPITCIVFLTASLFWEEPKKQPK